MKSQIGRLAVLALAAATIALSASLSRAQDLAAAKDTYKTLCVKCHGPSGKGDGPAGATLATKPGDLSDCVRMAKVSDDVLFKIIKEGGPSANLSKEMAPFKDGLEDNEIKDMVAYVRTLCQK
jgi:cytochrome c oxidase cbb3-type subunit 3